MHSEGTTSISTAAVSASPDHGIVNAQREPPQTQSALVDRRGFIGEKIFTVIMLFYMTGAVLPLIIGNPDRSAFPQIKPIDLAVKAVLYIGASLFIVRQRRRFIQGLQNTKWILLLLVIAIVSTVWSQAPSLTLRGSAVLLATTAFGVYFGSCYAVSEQLRLLAWTCCLVLTSSYLFALFLPGYGTEQAENVGDWKGAFIQKNNLAEATVLAVLVFLFARPMSRSLRCVGLTASFVLLFLSGSATGIIVCVGIITTLPLYKLIRARLTLVIPVSIGVGLLFAGSLLVLKTNSAEVFHLVNRSPDLTGRSELWSAVLFSISKRPWLGYGFSAFWQGMNGESKSVMDAVGWMPGFAHNGFLDVLLQLGVLGLVTFTIGYFVLWRRALALLSRARGPNSIWLCTFLVFMLLYNITEGCILTQNDVYWVLYISTAVNLSSHGRAKYTFVPRATHNEL